MKSILLITVSLTISAIPVIQSHEAIYEESPSHRGCVASAHQATTNGFADNLETNLKACDQL